MGVSSFTIWYLRVTTRVFSIGVDGRIHPSMVVVTDGRCVSIIRFVHSFIRPSVRASVQNVDGDGLVDDGGGGGERARTRSCFCAAS